MKSTFILTLGLLLTITNICNAKDVYYGSSPELIKISKETIFRFHKQVRTISRAQRFEIKPADINDPDYSMLTIRPRFSKGTSKVAFVLSDSSTVTLNLKIVKGSNSSSEPFYDLLPKSLLIERTEKNLPALTVMDFIKSIDRGDNIVGYKSKVESKWLSTGKIRGVSAKLIKTYSGKEYKGYVIELKNKYKSKKYQIKPELLKLKDSGKAIITLVDRDLLLPRSSGNHKTLLKVVTKPSTSVKDIILPIFVFKENKGDKS